MKDKLSVCNRQEYMVWYGNILFDILHNNIKYTDSV